MGFIWKDEPEVYSDYADFGEKMVNNNEGIHIVIPKVHLEPVILALFVIDKKAKFGNIFIHENNNGDHVVLYTPHEAIDSGAIWNKNECAPLGHGETIYLHEDCNSKILRHLPEEAKVKLFCFSWEMESECCDCPGSCCASDFDLDELFGDDEDYCSACPNESCSEKAKSTADKEESSEENCDDEKLMHGFTKTVTDVDGNVATYSLYSHDPELVKKVAKEYGM